MSLEAFSKRMVIRADQLGQSVDATVRTVALLVDQVVVLATPVDTGKARSNWIVSIGIPSSDIRQPYAVGRFLGLSETENARGALDHARRVVLQRVAGAPIYIVNNVDYMAELNNGSSRQAPKNFVEIGVQQGVAAVKAAKIFSK